LLIVHRYLGALLVALFLVLMVWGVVLRVRRREDVPTAMWATQHWTENLLVVQTVLGLILLLMGRRVVGIPLAWLHYLYGSVFPLIAVVGGRIAGLRRESREYVGLAWGAFFAFALTVRALQTACLLPWRGVARTGGEDRVEELAVHCDPAGVEHLAAQDVAEANRFGHGEERVDGADR
jgi:hypothetical protein